MSLYSMLYNWQQKIVDKFAYKKNFGIWIDCGLGKTPLSLSFAEYNKCDKVIVVTLNGKALETVDTSGSWLQWASKSAMNYELKTKYDTSFKFNQADLFVINYEGLFERGANKVQKLSLKQSVKNFILSCKGHNVAIIVDESHRVKNLNSLQSKAVAQIKKELLLRATKVYTYLLTGTPFTTGYEDLWAQLKLLGSEMTKTQFIDKFCVRGHVPGLLGWQQPIVDYKNLDELYHLVHQYAITIKSDDVVNLPEQIFTYHTTGVSPEFTALISEKLKGSDIINIYKSHKLTPDNTYKLNLDKKINNPFFRNLAYPDLKWLAETSGTLWLRARELSIGFQGNAEEAVWYDRRRLDLLKHFLEFNEDNYVLFYNYTPELIELYDICESLGYNVDVYSGSIKSLNFYERFSKMSETQQLVTKKNIILANFASGSTGMNWQLYNKCIIFSLPIYKDYEQGIKRIHRIGQKNNTQYHIFYQQNWLDEGMRKALETKTDYSTDMFQSDLARVQSIKEE